MTESPSEAPAHRDFQAENAGRVSGRVLVARPADRAVGLMDRLRAAGAEPVAAPVTERLPVQDTGELDAARERLARGEYAWVAITSVNAVDALLPQGPGFTHLTLLVRARWAAVGPATRRALEARGVRVDLVPETASAAGLAAAFPRAGAGNRVLLPLGDLAEDTLAAGLAAKGWTPDVVTAYRTVARTIPDDLRRQSFDLVVVTSGSAARAIAAQLGPQRVVTIGEPSARAAREVGHTVVRVAAQPTDGYLADAALIALDDLAHTALDPKENL